MDSFFRRILTGWFFVRVLYLIIGISFLVQSIQDGLWLGIFFGTYLISMGLFRLGCAAGVCHPSKWAFAEKKEAKRQPNTADIEFEEVK